MSELRLYQPDTGIDWQTLLDNPGEHPVEKLFKYNGTFYNTPIKFGCKITFHQDNPELPSIIFLLASRVTDVMSLSAWTRNFDRYTRKLGPRMTGISAREFIYYLDQAEIMQGVKRIQGMWHFDSTNYDRYFAGIRKGMPKAEAARSTWTGNVIRNVMTRNVFEIADDDVFLCEDEFGIKRVHATFRRTLSTPTE